MTTLETLAPSNPDIEAAIQARRAKLTAEVARLCQWKVLRGPFAGMILPGEWCWGDGDVATKLLGIYEQELHLALNHFAQKQYGAILNIGCAEGYYAIGLSRMFPEIPVFAFDRSIEAQAICRKSALVNGRHAHVSVKGECGFEEIQAIAERHQRCLVFVDCESGELDLLSQELLSGALAASDLIVECHDFMRPGITRELSGRLERSHFFVNCLAGARNPNDIPFLRSLSDSDRWLIVSESRPCTMNWLIAEAKS